MMENPVSLLSFKSEKRLPIILQTEMAECGLACLSMISSYYGHKIDLNTLRRSYPVSLKGATLKSLMMTADHLKFSTRAVRLDMDNLINLKAPAILHWDLNHFVVLKQVKKDRVTIHDPARGIRTLTFSEASQHFTGVALELTPTQQFEVKNDETRMRMSDLWSNITGLKRILIQIFFLSLLLQVFTLVSPFYMQLVVDNVVVGQDLKLLVVLALGFLLLALISVGTDALRGYIIMYLSNQLSIQMAANLFRHLVHLPLSFFEKRHIGDIVSRFSSMDNIKNLMTTGLIETLVDGIMIITTLIMMFVYSPLLACIVLSVVALYALLRVAMYQPFRKLSEESIVANAKENTNFMETVRAAQSIKIFGREAQRQTLWHNHYADAMNADIKINKLKISYKAINDLLFGIENIAVIYFGATLVLEGLFSVGMLFAFTAYKSQFTGKAAKVIEKLIEFRMISLHLSRIADIALTPEEDLGPKGMGTKQEEVKGKLTVDNLSFQYSDAEPQVFRNVSYTFNPGESVAIVGPSGGGKTTLMKNLLGLLDPTSGQIMVDGIEIKKFGLNNYRSHIGAVMQDDQLLSGSLMDNISLFDADVDEERAIECAKLASIDSDIESMPMGYNTLIGDMGTTLSGGQRQRLLLARALYSQPKILFMDEATSNLDTKLESVVNEAVKNLNITRIIIAHRPETIRSADKVVSLNRGVLVEVDKDVLLQSSLL
ncbi:peptidase domain-containing ABC transporter [Pleionea sp. CnH1-48]|uniref:peptidase domain-containing ABC transporter n=1 Tax=Pleionea sp. CnH1-48 TaxID=2954494 RepID=UPI002097E3AB|nr:peptidase domain-containing ABC transporter [Pleionea sp. CnH1-48]MCO7226646.1 peptidase domain-containing ABC transporter [Pleionea sp. CnH1-48]